MAYRLIQLAVPEGCAGDIDAALRSIEPRNWWRSAKAEEDDPAQFFIILHEARLQNVLDDLRDQFEGSEGWRLTVSIIETVLPEIDDQEEQERLADTELTLAREEILSGVRSDAALTRDYVVLIAVASLLAAVGLYRGEVAVVIGAMVIAPILGPIMAFNFATALGNRRLLWTAVKSLGVGLGVAFVVSLALGFLFDVQPEPGTMLSFSEPLTWTTAALPLAGGVAAAIILLQGAGSGIVGVTVAAALVPPLAASGLHAGAGDLVQALRAGGTVIANIVAINLASQIVFMLKGVRPNRWLSDQTDDARLWNMGSWAVLLVLIMAYLLWPVD